MQRKVKRDILLAVAWAEALAKNGQHDAAMIMAKWAAAKAETLLEGER
jgi:hypothetical protein